MNKEDQLISLVNEAKHDNGKADELIRAYIPFIKKQASSFISRICTDQDDELSIALMAFHEAIISYAHHRGSFLKYASLMIKSRLTDYMRREARHRGLVYMMDDCGEDDVPLLEKLKDEKDLIEEAESLAATKKEIEELGEVLASFGVSFSDIADNSPRQKRTLDACARAVRYAVDAPDLLTELLQTKKVPMLRLSDGANVERKTLERHRKYILAMLIIQTNGYEIIRGHLRHVLSLKGGAAE